MIPVWFFGGLLLCIAVLTAGIVIALGDIAKHHRAQKKRVYQKIRQER